MRLPNTAIRGDIAINMTPMIDVVFLLIIFFLVSSHLAKQEANVKLDLPTAKTGQQSLSDRPQFTLNILTDGTWSCNGQTISQDKFREMIRRRYREEAGQLRVKIRVDRNQPYSILSEALKILGEEEIGDLVFGVYENDT